MTVTSCRGDPLGGGQLLGTRPVTPGSSGATHTVMVTSLGKRGVNLRDAQGQPGAPRGDLGGALRGATRVTLYTADPRQNGAG